MTTVAKMDAKLTMDSSKFSGSMKAAGGAIVAFTAVVTVAAGAITLLTKKEFGALDATIKLSRELGIAEDSLLGFNLAAGLTGTSAGDFEKAMRKLPKTIGEARRGLQTAKDGFEELNLDFEELSKIPVDEAMLRIADATKKMHDPTKKAAALSAIFGRSGQRLTNLLNLGSEALKEIRKDSERLNDTFSKQELGGIEAANDEVLRLKTSFSSVFKNVAVEAAPFVAGFANKLTNAIVSFRENTLPLIISWARQVGTIIRDGLIKWVPIIVQFGTAIASGLQLGFNLIVGLGKVVLGALGSIGSALGITGGATVSFATGLTDAIIVARFAFEKFDDFAGLAADGIALKFQTVINKITFAFELLKKITQNQGGLLTGQVSFADIVSQTSETDAVQEGVFKEKQLRLNLRNSTTRLIQDFISFRKEVLKEMEGMGIDIGKFLEFDFEFPDFDRGGAIIGGGEENNKRKNTNFSLRGIERGSAEAISVISNFEAQAQTVQQKQLAEAKINNLQNQEQIKATQAIAKAVKSVNAPFTPIKGF